MNYVNRLAELAADHANEFAQVVRAEKNFNIRNEKLHSLAQWLRLFMKSYIKYDYSVLEGDDIDKITIELINFLSICNGILDVSDGLLLIAKDYFKVIPKINGNNCFMKTRNANKDHDDYFKFNKNNRDYFKHIRAIFGQHPSNLNYPSNVRGFASWTFKSKSGIWSFDSNLYCNIYFDQEKESNGIKFHIYYSEIRNFIDTHIKYIDELIDFIRDSIKEELIKNSGEIDGWNNGDTSKEKIEVLKKEIGKRYIVNSYNHLLEAVKQLDIMLDAEPINGFENEFEEFMLSISKSIDEIHVNVTRCVQNEIEYFDTFDGEIRDAIGHGYYREKVSMFLLGQYRYHDMFKYVMDLACENLGIKKIHGIPDFYFLFFVLKKKNKFAVDPRETYQPI